MPSDHHHAGDVAEVDVGVLTISSTRSLDDDPGGDAIVAAIEAEAGSVSAREIVTDDRDAIQTAVRELRSRGDVEAIVTTGGTGITPDDVTVEAVHPLLDRELPGFGERFRARSVEDVGPMGMLSRAIAGVSDGVVVFCLPGSEQAARLGARELIAPILSHVVGLAQGSDHGAETHE